MSSVDKGELAKMESMRNVSSAELKKRFEAIDLKVRELENQIEALKHEQSKLALKWTEDTRFKSVE